MSVAYKKKKVRYTVITLTHCFKEKNLKAFVEIAFF